MKEHRERDAIQPLMADRPTVGHFSKIPAGDCAASAPAISSSGDDPLQPH